MSFVYELPTGGSTSRWIRGWSFSGFTQIQTGSPFSIFASEPEIATVGQLTDLARGSGGLYRLGFGRPNINGTVDELKQKGSDPTEQFFNASVLTSPLGGFGNLGRNILRNDYQKRFDVSLAKNTSIKETMGFEFRWDVFNLFNNVNFATPGNDLQDATDFGRILNTDWRPPSDAVWTEVGFLRQVFLCYPQRGRRRARRLPNSSAQNPMCAPFRGVPPGKVSFCTRKPLDLWSVLEVSADRCLETPSSFAVRWLD